MPTYGTETEEEGFFSRTPPAAAAHSEPDDSRGASAGVERLEGVGEGRVTRLYMASTLGMISSLSRLRSSSVFATGTSWNGGQRSGIVSPASL